MDEHKKKAKLNGPSNQLRFAALIRVSSEKQEKKGESLNTQKKQLTQNVMGLGRIVSWYGGQEHAVEGYEREEIDRLIKDSQENPRMFDAVIVADPDRWSRDNVNSKQKLRILRDRGIRFFTGTTEWDLYHPSHILYLGMAAEIGEFQANIQNLKSLKNRIERAKDNKPAAGSLPFGRTYDEEAGWSIDKEKRFLVEDAARRYIAGEKLSDVADEYGMNHSVLHQILTQRCGHTWIQSFNSDRLNIHETVETKIPPLLSEDTIKAIHKRAEANKSYSHRGSKYRYLLNRMVFCGHCGCVMGAQTTEGKYCYYRHLDSKVMSKRICKRPPRCNQVNGRGLEKLVIQQLFELFGDPLVVQKAIERATPNYEKVKQERKRLEKTAMELEKVKLGRDRILRLIVRDKLTEDQAETELAKLNTRETLLKEKRARLCDALKHLPDPKAVKIFSQRFNCGSIAEGTTRRMSKSQAWFEHMSFEQWRAIIEVVFGGRLPDGRRMGVYITWVDSKHWVCDIHGYLTDQRDLSLGTMFDFDEGLTGARQEEFLSTLALYCPPTLRRTGMPPARAF